MLRIQNKKRELAAGAFATTKPSAKEVKQTKINEIKALIDVQLVVFSVDNVFYILVNAAHQVTSHAKRFAVFVVKTQMLQINCEN